MCWYFLFSDVWVCSHRNFVVWVFAFSFWLRLGPSNRGVWFRSCFEEVRQSILLTRNVDFSRQRAATLRTAGMRAHHRRCCKPLPMRAVLYSHRCWISKTWSCAGCQMLSCIGCCLLTLQQARVKTNAPVGALIRSWLSGFNASGSGGKRWRLGAVHYAALHLVSVKAEVNPAEQMRECEEVATATL